MAIGDILLLSPGSLINAGGNGNGIADNSAVLAPPAPPPPPLLVPLIINPGNYVISSAITITRPFGFLPGAIIIVNGNTIILQPILFQSDSRITINNTQLSIDASIQADPYQQIFVYTSGSVTGTFGKSPVSVGWFGARPDGNLVTGAGTNNTSAFNRALGVRSWSATGPNIVVVPAGTWMVNGQINITQGSALIGAAMGSTLLVVPSSASGNIINLPTGSGPSSVLRNMRITGQNGGASNATGIFCAANGAQIDNIWCASFKTCIELASTDIVLSNFVVEHGFQEGVYVTIDSNLIYSGIVYECPVGIRIKHDNNESTPTIISNIKMSSISCIGVKHAKGRVKMTAVSVSHVNGGMFQTAGFVIGSAEYPGAVQQCEFIGYSATLGGPSVANTSSGVYITGGASNVNINGGLFKNFGFGIRVNTSGSTINIVGSQCINNIKHGIFIERATYLIVANTQCSYNGSSEATDSGIYLNVAESYERHNIVGNLCIQGGGGPQKYGIYVSANNSTSKSLITSNVCTYNATGQITIAGSSAGNITETNNLKS